MAIRIGPEGWVDDSDVFFGNGFWVITVFFIETFFEGIIHSIDGGFSVFVAFKGIDVGFLDEKENQKEGSKDPNDDDF